MMTADLATGTDFSEESEHMNQSFKVLTKVSQVDFFPDISLSQPLEFAACRTATSRCKLCK